MRAWPTMLMMAFLVPVSARAKEPLRAGDRYRYRPVTIEAQLAPLGSPVGLLGLAVDVALIPELSLTAGAGLGLASPQWAAGVRPRIPIDPITAIAFTAAYSRGSYVYLPFLDPAQGGVTKTFHDGSWINIDVGWEGRFASRVVLRAFFGLSQLVACSGVELQDTNPTVPRKSWPLIPYVGFAIGYSLGADQPR